MLHILALLGVYLTLGLPSFGLLGYILMDVYLIATYIQARKFPPIIQGTTALVEWTTNALHLVALGWAAISQGYVDYEIL